MSFTASVTLNGLSSSTLTAGAIAAVVNATASSMGVSTNSVTYVSQTVATRRMTVIDTLFGRQLSSNVVAKMDVVANVIDFSGVTNGTVLYNTLKTKLTTATTGTSFVKYLTAASKATGTTQTESVASVSAAVSAASIQFAPTYSPTTKANKKRKFPIAAIIGE